MKGIIFNLLEEVVSQEYGENTWDALLDASGLDGSYTSLGNYDDAQLLKLVAAASEATGKPPTEIVRWFGAKAIPMLAVKYPHFFQKHPDTRSFLLTLNSIIHPEVRKVYPGADVPDFDFDAPSADTLVMVYHSKRKLCALAEGLIDGAATHFGERAIIKQPLCMLRGDECCRLQIAFQKPGA